MASNGRKAVFLDRDGVINRRRADHVKCVEEVVFLPGAVEAVVRLSQAKWATVVVTNQAGVGKGLFPAEKVEEIHAHIAARVEAAGGRITAAYFCPHREEEDCRCRKPRPGLLVQAAAELGLDLSACCLIGDSLRDIAAAAAVGCIPILLGEKTWAGPPVPAMEVKSLAEATDWILKEGW